MPAKKKTVVTESASLELAIAVEGKIINSNFEIFREMAESMIDNISFDLKTDEDFEQADNDAKRLKKFEESLVQGKKDFLKQMDEVNSLLEGVSKLGDLSRSTRLELEKKIKEKKLSVREDIVRDALKAIRAQSREFTEAIQESMKGKSSLVKIQEAVTAVVNQINARIESNQLLFASAQEEHGDAVAYGESSFITLTVESAKIEIERRVERHKAALKEAELKKENERLRKEEEERQKAAEPAPVPQSESAKEVNFKAGATYQPVPTPIPIHTAVIELTQEQEAQEFFNIIIGAFAPVKRARESLKHEKNITAAQNFADKLGAAWATFKQEVAQ